MDGIGGRGLTFLSSNLMCLIENTLTDWFKSWLPAVSGEPTLGLVVALSGGRDSLVLLHALKAFTTLHSVFTLRAVHVNHGLQSQAAHWERHCQRQCEVWQIPFMSLQLACCPQRGESMEKVARTMRYQALQAVLCADEYLLTAHTQDDQAETFLLQLARGAGPKGLSAMPSVKPFGKGKHGRPFLNVPRKVITEYARFHQLNWIEDDSNQNTAFSRNFIRHHVLPALHQHFPNVHHCIARSARHCADHQALLDEYLDRDFQACVGAKLNRLCWSYFNAFSPLKQIAIFRYWLQQNHVYPPSTKRVKVILQQMGQANRERRPSACWGGVEVRRYRDELYLLDSVDSAHKKRSLQNHANLPGQWDLTAPLCVDGQYWKAEKKMAEGIDLKCVVPAQLEVRFRQGGERCYAFGAPYRRPLKKLLQELQIPTWERFTLPLFYYQNNLVAVGDLFICDDWKIKQANQLGWIIKKV